MDINMSETLQQIIDNLAQAALGIRKVVEAEELETGEPAAHSGLEGTLTNAIGEYTLKLTQAKEDVEITTSE